METLFLNILNISISAGWLILAVFILRAIFPSTPKWIVCLFWLIVGIRLICPFTIESPLSLIPNNETVSFTNNIPTVNTGIRAIDSRVALLVAKNATGKISFSDSLLTGFNLALDIFSIVWFVGLLLMLLYMLFSYIGMKKKLRTATLLRENIYQSEFINAPFVMGITKPKIYIPYKVEVESIEQIILHEKAHLKRFDNITKVIAFFILSIYWINPIIWLAFIYLCKDIEYATDEKVVKMMGCEEKRTYSKAILDNSVKDFSVVACPFSFGGGALLFRIEKIKDYKKPKAIVTVFSLFICLLLATMFLTSNVTVSGDTYFNNAMLSDACILRTSDASSTGGPCWYDISLKIRFEYTKVEYECHNGSFYVYTGDYDEDSYPLFENSEKMTVNNETDVGYNPYWKDDRKIGDYYDTIKFKIYNEEDLKYEGMIDVYYLYNEKFYPQKWYNFDGNETESEIFALKLVDNDDIYLKCDGRYDLYILEKK